MRNAVWNGVRRVATQPGPCTLHRNARWARRAVSTQSADDRPDDSIHEMLQQTCKDFVDAQLKPIAAELDKNHRRAPQPQRPPARSCGLSKRRVTAMARLSHAQVSCRDHPADG
eukprot:scaffold502_cov115-Isochrysis_galbana.AAC.17